MSANEQKILSSLVVDTLWHGEEHPLGEVFRPGEQVAVRLSVTAPRFVYVVQVSPDRKARLVYPDAGQSQQVLPTGEQRLPAGGGWLHLEGETAMLHVYLKETDAFSRRRDWSFCAGDIKSGDTKEHTRAPVRVHGGEE